MPQLTSKMLILFITFILFLGIVIATVTVVTNKKQETGMSDEALMRKKRSIAVLKEKNIPFYEHLPVIETVAESTRRATEEVATRSVALVIVAVKGEGLEQELIEELVKKYDAASAFTPDEKLFIENQQPTEKEKIQFSWRYECYWVMLWALGYVDKIEDVEKICDVKRAVTILQDNGPKGFYENAKLRPQDEILDAADLIYRYHWAIRDANVNNKKPPAGLDAGVIMERHHALNWLIGYMDQQWDDVTCDT